MTNEELSALVRHYVFESTEATAPALLAQIQAEHAKRGQLYETKGD
jgi:hypothetical protein